MHIHLLVKLAIKSFFFFFWVGLNYTGYKLFTIDIKLFFFNSKFQECQKAKINGQTQKSGQNKN